MYHKVYKYFINYEKEEKWLNEMASKGLNFLDFSFPCRYLFEESNPGEYIYRLELLESLPSSPESKAYIKFLEDTGIESVCTYMRWVYFKKKSSEGPFDIYSDNSSRIRHYKRVSLLTGFFGFANLFVGLMNVFIGFFSSYHSGIYVNFYCAALNILLSIFIISAFISYRKKIRWLKRESRIKE